MLPLLCALIYGARQMLHHMDQNIFSLLPLSMLKEILYAIEHQHLRIFFVLNILIYIFQCYVYQYWFNHFSLSNKIIEIETNKQAIEKTHFYTINHTSESFNVRKIVKPKNCEPNIHVNGLFSLNCKNTTQHTTQKHNANKKEFICRA